MKAITVNPGEVVSKGAEKSIPVPAELRVTLFSILISLNPAGPRMSPSPPPMTQNVDAMSDWVRDPSLYTVGSLVGLKVYFAGLTCG